jgi:hypothetical protein
VVEGTVIVGIGDLAFMASDDPGLVEDLFLLFAEEHVIRVNTGVHKVGIGKVGLFMPLGRVA